MYKRTAYQTYKQPPGGVEFGGNAKLRFAGQLCKAEIRLPAKRSFALLGQIKLHLNTARRRSPFEGVGHEGVVEGAVEVEVEI